MRFLATVYKYRKPWNIEKILNLTPENGIHTKSRVQKQSWQTKHFTNSKLLSRNVFKNRHTLKALSKFINIHKLPLIFIKWGFNKVSWVLSNAHVNGNFVNGHLNGMCSEIFPNFPEISIKLTLNAPWQSRIFL